MLPPNLARALEKAQSCLILKLFLFLCLHVCLFVCGVIHAYKLYVAGFDVAWGESHNVNGFIWPGGG